MYFSKAARVLLPLLGVSSQAHTASAYDCFGADGTDLKTEADAYTANPSGYNISKYGPIDQWCTTPVTNMNNLFYNKASFNANITAWDTSKVTSMRQMFRGAQAFNQDLSAWDTSSVNNMEHMFRGSQAFNQNISGWDTSKVTTMRWMFHSAQDFNEDLSGWDTSSVTDMSSMFYSAQAFNQDLSAWDTSNVTAMSIMFGRAHAFNQDLSAWVTSSVTDMWGMFKEAYAFNQDLSAWDTSALTGARYMFYEAIAFNQNLCAWKDNFPYSNAEGIFTGTSCTYLSDPNAANQGPFCAGSAAECQAYTAVTPLPTKSPTNSPTNSPTPAAAAPISSWALEFVSLSSNFTKGSESEVTINYKIGAGRNYQVDILKKGCKEEITGAVITPTYSVSSIEDDPSRSNFQASLDIQKDTIANSNIINEDGNILELCVSFKLTSDGSGEVKVMKKLETNVGIELLFNTEFETVAEAQFGKISLESKEDEAEVSNYIKACTCNDKESFTCNTNVLGPDDFLNICIQSLVADEMEINYLDSLKMTQEDGNELVIVEAQKLVDGTISSMSSVKPKNNVHVATVIPASFFSYNEATSAQVSGVVYLKLQGSRRRLAVEIAGNGQPEAQAQAAGSSSATSTPRALQAESTGTGDEESAFAIEVKLQKSELGDATNANGAINADKTKTGFVMMW
eukprot:scaffold9111_cov90-Skeletonema_dohrnii-CCMP3373.AAC.3